MKIKNLTIAEAITAFNEHTTGTAHQFTDADFEWMRKAGAPFNPDGTINVVILVGWMRKRRLKIDAVDLLLDLALDKQGGSLKSAIEFEKILSQESDLLIARIDGENVLQVVIDAQTDLNLFHVQMNGMIDRALAKLNENKPECA